MITEHKIFTSDARTLNKVSDETVDLIVTSPPYPMIEMWDEIFFLQNDNIKKHFTNGEFELSFEEMHKELDKVWRECYRVLKTGGFACINIGDATRTLSGNFRLFSNHSRILTNCISIGFQNLPNIIWRKQTNAPNKFMGSGMLPAGAYVTLEHEFILVLRKGNKREFKITNEKEKRHQAAYFWEERNIWFSDLWDLKGTKQLLQDEASRKRSAAFPYMLPYRLINMYSTLDDLVLDPFLGTGTTMLAAIGARRNSIGIEIDEGFTEIIKKFIQGSENYLNDITQDRINTHLEFVKSRNQNKGEEVFKYKNENYGFPVMTQQEKKLIIPVVNEISLTGNTFRASYKDSTEQINFRKGSLFA